MKLISKIAVVGAMLLLPLVTPKVHAQYVTYNAPDTALSGGTNNLAASTTNSAVNVQFPCTRTGTVGLMTTFKMIAGAETDPIVFKFDWSLDSANWQANVYSLSVVPNGTNAVTTITNWTVGGVGWIRLNVIENPNTNAVTNLVFKASGKSGL